jgi:hypothetical protein
LVSAKFFAHRDVVGRGAPGQQSGWGALERQQAVLLELLRAREGAPASFTELQHAGIEFPASVVSELELAGAPIERCVFDVRGARAAGVRLRSTARAPVTPATPATPATLGVRRAPSADAQPIPGERARARPPSSRLLAPAGLLVALGAIVALALSALTTGSGAGASHAVTHSRPHQPAFSATTRNGGSPRRAPGAATADNQPPALTPTPVSETLAAQLQAQGHELLQAGRSGEAVPILTRALTATGEHLQECLQPASETCLTYAYALYDLGRALALDGDPAAAVGVLQRRLQIDNQRPTVVQELQRARAQTD